MDPDSKTTGALPADGAPAAKKKGLHGALKFVLMMIAGAILTFVLVPCGLGIMGTEVKTLHASYNIAMYTFLIGGGVSILLTLIAGLMRRWGISGFFFGMAILLTVAYCLAFVMRIFDEPNWK
jgi:hypothetical protein